jgi:hypothetical protein
MSIVLDRLRAPFPQPGQGQITLAVARHEAEVWPSPLLAEYAQQRSQLLHGLADELGVRITSWGETDGPIPREVVQVILELSATIVPSLASVLAAWITVRPRKVNAQIARQSPGSSAIGGQASVPGFVVVRPDGARLEITYRTAPSKRERLATLTTFLNGALLPDLSDAPGP